RGIAWTTRAIRFQPGTAWHAVATGHFAGARRSHSRTRTTMADDFDLLAVQDRIWESELRHPEKCVALALLEHWSRNGRVFPGIDRLAKLTSLGRRTVIRSIGVLEDCGAIRAAHTRGKPTEYDLTPLASLVVPERHRCQSGTSATQAPDQCHTGTRVVP